MHISKALRLCMLAGWYDNNIKQRWKTMRICSSIEDVLYWEEIFLFSKVESMNLESFF